MDSVAEYVYNSRPDAEVMPHVVEVWGGVMGGERLPELIRRR